TVVGPTAADPVAAALSVVRRAGDRVAAGELLADAAAWTTLLSRPWPGGTEDLAAVVTLAAAGPAAATAAGAALRSLGRGLAPDSPNRVLVDQGTFARIGAEVSGLVAGQTGVLVSVLEAAVRDGGTGGALDASTDTQLRGLAHLFAEEARSAPVVIALHAAARAAGVPAPRGAELVGATVAVQEHGQRLRYALAYSQEQEAVVDRQLLWTIGVGTPTSLVHGPAEDLVEGIVDSAATLVGADGEVRMGPDDGPVRTAADAERAAVELLTPAAPDTAAVEAAARDGFEQVAATLGRLDPPSPSLLDRLDDLPLPEHEDRRRHRWERLKITR
uniref:hypothetical protein n=1 Tax=Modestobacter marinus TaxID=477641 RepID=UPI00201A626D